MTMTHGSIVYRRSVRSDDSGVVLPAGLDRALLCVVVHVHDPEPTRVSMAPLEVVEERPHVVAAQLHPLTHRFACRVQMVAEVSDSQRIVDAPIHGRRRIIE